MTAIRLDYAAAFWEDLLRLQEFLLAQGNPGVDAWIDTILDAVELLEKQPGIGRPMPGGLRELIIERGHTGYLALYRYDRKRQYVRILRIRHQRECGYLELDAADENDDF